MRGIGNLLFWESLNPINYIMDVVNLIPKLVYFITATAMGLLDIAQMLMRKLAGLDVHYTAEGNAQTGDITLSFLQGIFGGDPNYAALRNAFWSLIILAVILLFVSTIIAVIRQEYMPGQDESREKPSNSKVHVINRAVKSLFMFLIVPVSVFFGLMFSDAILRAMDAITSGSASSSVITAAGVAGKDGEGKDIMIYPTDLLVAETVGDGKTTSYVNYDFFSIGIPTTSTPFSGFAFKAAGFSANRVRIGKTYKLNNEDKSFYQLVKMGNVSNFSIFNFAESEEEMASMMDDVFAGNMKLKNTDELKFNSAANKDIKNSLVFQTGNVNRFSKYNVPLVWYYYDLWQYNFVIAFAFLIVSTKIMIKIIMGLMKRIVEIIVLFLVSPPVIALMPLDGGKTFNQWKSAFLAKALGVYGAIIGMNILFLLLPYINQIKFLEERAGFSGNVLGQEVTLYHNAAKMVNLIISTLFIIVGLVAVEGLISMMSKIIGADDLGKEGGDIAEKTGDTLQKSLNTTALVAGGAAKAVTAPLKMARDGANAIGRKATGNKDFKIEGAIGRKAVGALKKLPMGISRKRQEEVEKKHNVDWQKKGGLGDQAYDKYLESQDSYQSSMNSAFEGRSNQDLSRKDWLQSEEGVSAREGALATAQTGDVQSRERFIGGMYRSKEKGGAGKEAYDKSLKSTLRKEHSIGANLKEGGYLKGTKDSKFGRGVASMGRGLFKAGASVSGYAGSFMSDYMGVASEPFNRKDKPKMFESMIRSFKGESAKTQAQNKKILDYYKEQKRKSDYEKSRGGGGSGGAMSRAEVERLIKSESAKQKTKLEEDFKRELEKTKDQHKKELDEQAKAQQAEIDKFKNKGRK